jgi:hypothetical protein
LSDRSHLDHEPPPNLFSLRIAGSIRRCVCPPGAARVEDCVLAPRVPEPGTL